MSSTKKFLIWIAFCAFLLCLSGIATATAIYTGWQTGPWKRHSQRSGMTLWINEDVPSGVDGVRVDATIPLPADKLFPIIIDEKRASSYSFIREFRILEQHDDWGYLYQRVRSRGIQDRDFTVRLQMIKPSTHLGGPYGWVWQDANDKGPPERDGVVRAAGVSGSYLLTPTNNGQHTLVSYRLYFDPSSWVPDFLINRAVRNACMETVDRLRKDSAKL